MDGDNQKFIYCEICIEDLFIGNVFGNVDINSYHLKPEKQWKLLKTNQINE